MEAKQRLAEAIASRVKGGETIGIGTGSTVDAVLGLLEQRVQEEKLALRAVTTSLQSSWRCQEIGIEVLSPTGREQLSWGFDGADAVDSNLWLIKGKGAALLQEKIVAARCKHFVIVADESKFTENLAQSCAVPVEVIPAAIGVVEKELKLLGALSVTLRAAGSGKHGPVITEAGNIILDAQFKEIGADSEKRIKQIVGVVESGLFIGYAHEIMIGSGSGVRVLKR